MGTRLEPNEHGITAFLNKVAACMIINACWLVACLPVVTIGPACTAMYTAIKKTVLQERGYGLIEFWKAFRSNLRKGIKIWIGFLFIQAIMIFDIRFLYQQVSQGHTYGLLYLLVAVLLILSVLAALYSFAYQARFHGTCWKTVRSSVLIMLMHPFKNLLILVMAILLVILVSMQMWMLLFLPVFWMLFFCQYMENSFYKMMSKEEKEKEDERNCNIIDE